MNELALFAGAGGGILGGKRLGWRTVCAVEIDPYCRSVLLARQRDGMLPHFPIWDDVRTFDGQPWRGHIDVISGGFPCQDISAAGKGAGLAGARSGLWAEFARIIGEIRPRFAFIENSPLLRCRGLVTVLQDLARLGYDARWGVLGADDVGAPHRRKRMWIVATNAECQQVRYESRRSSGKNGASTDVVGFDGENEQLADTQSDGRGQRRTRGSASGGERQPEQSFPVSNVDGTGRNEPASAVGRERFEEVGSGQAEHGGLPNHERCWWSVEPNVGRVANGVASRMDRLRAIGNGQVPAVVKLAWNTLSREVTL